MISRIKAIISSVDLTRLDKRRIDLAMAWAQRHPVATVVYNIGNYLFLGIIKIGLLTAESWTRLKKSRQREKAEADRARDPEPMPLRRLTEKPRVLLVVEDSIPQCFEYRVKQKIEMLDSMGWETAWLPWSDIDGINRDVHFFDVILLYRVPGFDSVLAFIEYAIRLNKTLIYDVDDLVFDRAQLERKFSSNRGQLSRKVYRELLNGADLYRRAIETIPHCLVSTLSLKHEVERIGKVRGYVLPNGISAELVATAGIELPRRDPGYVNILYGSGTKTHDADFSYLSSVLEQLLSEFQQMRLIIVGPVNIDQVFSRFGDRVTTVGFLEYASYLEVLAYADINVAPLQPGIFADCKSEIKWLEAGMLGVPSVVSNTRTYTDVIEQGVTGFTAANTQEWHTILSRLIRQPELRRQIASSAKKNIEQNYSREQLAQIFGRLIHSCGPDAAESTPAKTTKQRLMLVNTLYPPQAMGGATRVVKDLIDGISRDYAELYEISVFTCDITSTRPYAMEQYVHDGIVVTSLSVPMRPDFEIQYQDEQVDTLFKRILTSVRPHIVHFHSVQRLSASVVSAAYQFGIPYVVTLHDSWWLSDHPFMIDDDMQLLPSNVSNPLVAERHSADPNATISRNRYLRDRLRGARALIAVSEYQAGVYRDNGFSRVQVIENGVDRPDGYNRKSEDKLVLGYLGGKSVHKGYYFLKDSISQSRLRNTRVIITDLFSKDDKIRSKQWGGTPVAVYPKYDFSKAGEFYSNIDVLVVPSLWPESFGLVVREAALLGIWVVAADAGGLAGAVKEGKTGHTFEPGDKHRFKTILSELDREWRKYKQPVTAPAIADLGINPVSNNVRDTHDLYQRISCETSEVGRATGN